MKSNKLIYILFIVLLTGTFIPSQAQVKVTDGAVLTMDPNSLLELESTNKGLLLPRVALTDLNLPAPLTAPVPTGMFVYSSGGTVPDGFYYWSRAKWERVISTGTNILQTVTKSVSSTLTKTDNIVLASNDITLTLPAVTSADDGLAITVKNVGTYTDLITVVPEAGKTIDNATASLHTRWVGRTYIATGSNWIVKDKETRPDNEYEVSELGSFTSIAEVVAFLNVHMTGPSLVKLGGGTYQIDATQTINLSYPVSFEGLSSGATTITAGAGVSGSPLFICETACHFKMLTFMTFAGGAGNDAIRLTNSGTYHEILNCTFYGFNKGIVSTSNHSSILVLSGAFVNCAGAGIELAEGAASNGVLAVENCMFLRCAKGIHLLSGVSQSISIRSNTFTNTIAGSDIGVLYVPATLTSYKNIYITNNSWNNQGIFISGFDFSRSDSRDANVFLISNAGTENENPHCKINVVNNASTTTITTAGTFYKANWTNTSFYTSKWTINNNNITYQPDNSTDAWAIITGDISVNGPNRTISFAIIKNGITASPYGSTALRTGTAGDSFQFSTVIYIANMVKNDYLELFVTSSSSGDLVTFKDVQWFTNTQ